MAAFSEGYEDRLAFAAGCFFSNTFSKASVNLRGFSQNFGW